MPDTTTILREGAELPGDVVSGLAQTVGALANEAKHHAEAIAEHGAAIADGKDKLEWLERRMGELEQTATAVPGEAITALRSEVEALRNDLTTRTAALSEAIQPELPEEPETEPPPAEPNEAEPPPAAKGPLGGLRAALHRLL